MQLRLSRFDGLRLSLDRGWYLVPSHMSEDEVRRLLDVLASGLDGVKDVVELDWEDGERLGPNFGAGTLAYLRVPETDARAQIEAVVAGWELRLGLLHLPDAVCWPDPAWDELEVKSALVGWFRREFARKDHPFARLGLAEFPLQQVAEVTAEPIELIELIEAALGQRGEEALDWESCIDDSIGRRLSSRLEEDEIHAAELVELLVANDNGHLRASMHPHATAALVKLGLATQASDDVLLGPLARCAGRDAVRRSLGASAAEWRADELEWRPLRRLIDITASLAELGYTPGPELARALTDDSAGPPRVFVVHQSGMGGSTVIREILAERAVHGDYAVFVDMSDSAMDSELTDLLLIMYAKLLTRLAEAKLEIDRTAFDDLERGFTELRTRVVGDEGAMFGVPRSEQVSPRELRRFAQWSMSAQRSLSGKSWSGVRAELLAKVEKLLAMFSAALSTRQQRVVLVLENFWMMPSRATIDEFVTILEKLSVPLVFDWASVDGGLPKPANRRVVVHVPPLPLRGKSDGREVVRTQLLDVALELLASAGEPTESVADPEVLRELVRLSGGCIHQLLMLKYKVEESASGRLTIDDLHEAADGLAQDLISNLPLRTSESAKLREIIQTRSLPLSRLDGLLNLNRVFMYEGGAWVDVNPLLWRLPGFVKTFGPENGRPRGVLARMRDRLQIWLDLPF